jgi:hypothetical protein
MGGSGDSNAWQHFNIGTGIFATGAFWNDNFYTAGNHGPLISYSFNSSTNLFNTSIASQSSASYSLGLAIRFLHGRKQRNRLGSG